MKWIWAIVLIVAAVMVYRRFFKTTSGPDLQVMATPPLMKNTPVIVYG